MAALLRAQRALMGNSVGKRGDLSPLARAPKPGCVFCGFYADRDPRELLHKDEHCAAFKDHRPSAAAHYLVIPREHVHDTSHLRTTPEDHALVEHMMGVGRRLLEESMPGAEYQFGYHPPPFNSMQHLHLHCFALPFTPWWKKYKYFQLFSPVMYISGEHMGAALRPHGGAAPAPVGDGQV